MSFWAVLKSFGSWLSVLIEDDGRLLLGIHFHGFGNWESIRLDERLGLTKKISPVELQHHETLLPRAPQLKERASQLLEMEVVAAGKKTPIVKAGRKNAKRQNVSSRVKARQGRPGSPVQPIKLRSRSQKTEPFV